VSEDDVMPAIVTGPAKQAAMNLDDKIKARIRTVWPILLGHVATFAVAMILRLSGIEVDSAVIIELTSALASWGIWEAGRRLETSGNKYLAPLGRWLISAGREIAQPNYGSAQTEQTTHEFEYWPDGTMKTARSLTTFAPRAMGVLDAVAVAAEEMRERYKMDPSLDGTGYMSPAERSARHRLIPPQPAGEDIADDL
jgi:hypothetical protein